MWCDTGGEVNRPGRFVARAVVGGLGEVDGERGGVVEIGDIAGAGDCAALPVFRGYPLAGVSAHPGKCGCRMRHAGREKRENRRQDDNVFFHDD